DEGVHAALDGRTPETDFLLRRRRMNEKHQEVLGFSERLYNQGCDWVTFFREVLGVNGIVRRTYTTPDELAQFEQTQEYAEIQRMLAKLRDNGPDDVEDKEPTRVITVRLPKSLHEALRSEAHDRRTSMNKLCISKLLQMIEQELVPSEA